MHLCTCICNGVEDAITDGVMWIKPNSYSIPTYLPCSTPLNPSNDSWVTHEAVLVCRNALLGEILKIVFQHVKKSNAATVEGRKGKWYKVYGVSQVFDLRSKQTLRVTKAPSVGFVTIVNVLDFNLYLSLLLGWMTTSWIIGMEINRSWKKKGKKTSSRFAGCYLRPEDTIRIASGGRDSCGRLWGAHFHRPTSLPEARLEWNPILHTRTGRGRSSGIWRKTNKQHRGSIHSP